MNRSDKGKIFKKKDIYFLIYLYCIIVAIFIPIGWILDYIGYFEATQILIFFGILIEAFIAALVLFFMSKLVKPIEKFEKSLEIKINKNPKFALIILYIISFIMILIGLITLLISIDYLIGIMLITFGISSLLFNFVGLLEIKNAEKSNSENNKDGFKKYRWVRLIIILFPFMITGALIFIRIYQKQAWTVMYLMIIIIVLVIAHQIYKKLMRRKKLQEISPTDRSEQKG